MQEQMGNLTREVHAEKIYKARNIKDCSHNEKCFLWLIRELNMAKERISELEDMRIETSQTEKQVERRMKKIKNKTNRISKNYVLAQKCNMFNGNTIRRRKNVAEEIFEGLTGTDFPNNK